MHMIVTWLATSLAVWVTAQMIPGFRVKGARGALVVAAVFGFLNWALGFFLFFLFGVMTLGIGFLFWFLTRWVVNALLFKLTDKLTDSLEIDGFGTALVGSAIVSLVSTAAQWLLPG